MRKTVTLVAVLVVLADLALGVKPEPLRHWCARAPRQSPSADEVIDGTLWRQAMTWDFRDGPYPGAWSWGDWRIVDGLLEGRDDDGRFAVYVCPFEHGRDFMLETRVRILANSPGRFAEAHLLTRDNRELHHESGAVLFGDQRRVSARHMVDRVDYVLHVIKPRRSVTEGLWHMLRFSVRDGRVQIWLDGTRIFRSDRRYPAGDYREPHIAVRNGVAQFSGIKILVAP